MSLAEIAILLLLLSLCVDSAKTKSPIPLWKNLLVRHPSWAGYVIHYSNNNRYMCSLRTLSTQLDDDGITYVEFTSEHTSIEMQVTSDDNKIVIFKEQTTWNKTAHFEGHSNLQFKGKFNWDQHYYKFNGNISSTETQMFGEVILLPDGKAPPRIRNNHNSNVGLYVGIPIVVAIIVLSLGALTMVWAFRKGYLRHVPWSYKAFRNPRRSRRDIDLDKNKTTSETAEEPTVHI